MPQVVFVLGLCGAGKSTRARELSAHGFDNFDEKVTGRPVHPDLKRWPKSAYHAFLQAVTRGRDCVVTEILFYLPDAQQQVGQALVAARPDVVIQWESFDHADLEVANHNCQSDPDRSPEGIRANLEQNVATVERLRAGTYRLPSGTKLLKTVRRAHAP
jgi:hypothetical protein